MPEIVAGSLSADSADSRRFHSSLRWPNQKKAIGANRRNLRIEKPVNTANRGQPLDILADEVQIPAQSPIPAPDCTDLRMRFKQALMVSALTVHLKFHGRRNASQKACRIGHRSAYALILNTSRAIGPGGPRPGIALRWLIRREDGVDRLFDIVVGQAALRPKAFHYRKLN
jgi:hypothetical protein